MWICRRCQRNLSVSTLCQSIIDVSIACVSRNNVINFFLLTSSRAVTEKHAFYSCETVRNAVTSQFIRDLKGTIVSLFNEKTPLGKNYVFDIRRTCREVYDHTRRVLHQLDQGEQQVVSKSQAQQHQQPNQSTSKLATGYTSDESSSDLADTIDSLDASEDKNVASSVKCTRGTCIESMKKLASLRDSLLCRICMDSDACTAFFPCRHVVCCSDCSLLCDSCPICRSSIETTEKIYLPVSSCGKNAPNLDEYSSAHWLPVAQFTQVAS